MQSGFLISHCKNILAKVPFLNNGNCLAFYIASRLIDKANLMILLKKKYNTLLKVVTKELSWLPFHR